jgi:hypothetical protein
MRIGLAIDDYFDSQEEDFYYNEYNNDDEEEREVWEDGEEVHLQVLPKLLHVPDRRGKKRLRMQRRPFHRSDAEIAIAAGSLFASPPTSPFNYFHQTTATTRAVAECIDRMDAGAAYTRHAHCNDDV